MLIHLRRIAASGGKASKGKTSEAKARAARLNWKKAAAALKAKREKQERDHDDRAIETHPGAR